MAKSKKQLLNKRKRVITHLNKLRKSEGYSGIKYNLTLGELISLNWVLNDR